ncbi:unnamed protein product [Effrenium voratum]|nr:unnamed protein product [Effrenium voratum]
MEAEMEEIPPHLECAICMKLLLEPVSVPCGHTFCQSCLDQALGYRNLCAVCRAPVPPGQAVNVIIRSVIVDQYPRALASRQAEQQEEVRMAERTSEEQRQQEVSGEAEAASGRQILIMPIFRSAELLLPQCCWEDDLSVSQEQLVQYAVQGGRRVCWLQACEDLGVCMNVEDFRPAERARSAHVRLRGKFRVNLIEPPHLHQDGFELGRFEAVFDTPLPLVELTRAGSEAESEETAAFVADKCVQLIDQKLAMLGIGSRHAFVESCGEPPAAARRRPGIPATSPDLEQLSFWLLGSIIVDAAQRKRWVQSTDTKDRLSGCFHRLEAAGSRPILNLPGANSWMRSGSSWSSIALLVVIFALLLAKASGFFDGILKPKHSYSTARF